MKFVLFFSLLSVTLNLFAHSFEQLDMFYEAHKINHFTVTPWGNIDHKTSLTKHNWPFNVQSIGHSPASYQNYGWGDPAYFHHGIDIRGEAGESVVAAAGGKVVNIENYAASDLYWEVAILDRDGFLWQYHHIDHNSITPAIRNAYTNGSEIDAGTKIGEIVYWPVVTFGERFNHVHLNVLDGNLNYINPFLLLKKLDDQTAPKILDLGLIDNRGHISKKSSIKAGDYSLYLHTEDYIMHTKFKLPPYKISYHLDNQPEHIVWEFKTLPGGTSNEKYVDQFYHQKSCGDYRCRNIYINLNFNRDTPIKFPQTKGTHSIVVTVTDYVGHQDSKMFSWKVR